MALVRTVLGLFLLLGGVTVSIDSPTANGKKSEMATTCSTMMDELKNVGDGLSQLIPAGLAAVDGKTMEKIYNGGAISLGGVVGEVEEIKVGTLLASATDAVLDLGAVVVKAAAEDAKGMLASDGSFSRLTAVGSQCANAGLTLGHLAQ